jgi:hypothetical protein
MMIGVKQGEPRKLLMAVFETHRWPSGGDLTEMLQKAFPEMYVLRTGGRSITRRTTRAPGSFKHLIQPSSGS